jgi:hypothetical protein
VLGVEQLLKPEIVDVSGKDYRHAIMHAGNK